MTVRYRQNPAVESAPLNDGLMVLEPGARRFCALNRTSTLIWSRMQEPVTAEQLADHIAAFFQGVTRERALADVNAALKHMAALGIVETLV